MAVLIVGKLLHRSDALLIEEFHIVAGVAIEEIIRTHAEPEQMDFLIRGSSIVVDLRQRGRGKRAVAAEIRELIEVGQTDGECLVTTT